MISFFLSSSSSGPVERVKQEVSGSPPLAWSTYSPTRIPEAPKKWDPDFAKRKKIKALLDQSLPDFSVRLGGSTSIDVTLPGIDKAYGIRKLRDILGIPIAEMIYVGDALFPGGNDYPARETGAACIQVANPHETKRVIEAIIACADGPTQTKEQPFS